MSENTKIHAREGLTLLEVFEAAPDGETSWATHSGINGGERRHQIDGFKLKFWNGQTNPSYWQDGGVDLRFLAGWTLHERIPAKGES